MKDTSDNKINTENPILLRLVEVSKSKDYAELSRYIGKARQTVWSWFNNNTVPYQTIIEVVPPHEWVYIFNGDKSKADAYSQAEHNRDQLNKCHGELLRALSTAEEYRNKYQATHRALMDLYRHMQEGGPPATTSGNPGEMRPLTEPHHKEAKK